MNRAFSYLSKQTEMRLGTPSSRHIRFEGQRPDTILAWAAGPGSDPNTHRAESPPHPNSCICRFDFVKAEFKQ